MSKDFYIRGNMERSFSRERNNYNNRSREQGDNRNSDQRNSIFGIRCNFTTYPKDNSYNNGNDTNNKDKYCENDGNCRSKYFKLRTPGKCRERREYNHKNLLNIIKKDKLKLLCFVKAWYLNKNIEDLKEKLDNNNNNYNIGYNSKYYIIINQNKVTNAYMGQWQ